MNKKKLIVISVVIFLFIFLEAFVVRQFMGDLRLRQGRAILTETEDKADLSGEGSLVGYLLAGEYFEKAISWDVKNPDSHYWLARLYQLLTHRFARSEGVWDNKANLFIDGEKSRNYGQLAIEEFYRAIDINPACQYFHLELAWLLRSKLPTVPMTAGEMLDIEGNFSRETLSVYNTFREFEIATDLAPNRTMHHMSFGEFIVSRLAGAEEKGGIEVRVKDAYGRLLEKAVQEYGMALELTPSRIGDVLKSLTRVTTDYDILRPVIPADNMGLKTLVGYLIDIKGEEYVLPAFLEDMKSFAAIHSDSESAKLLFPYYDTLAGLYLKKNDYRSAASILEEYLERDPEDAATHGRAADIFMKEKNLYAAKTHLQRAASLDPGNPSYRRKLASVIISAYDPVEAETKLLEISASSPEDPHVYEALGNNYAKMGRAEDAKATYRKIIEKTKDNARGYYLLGKLYEEEGDKTEAAAYLKKAALLDGRYSRDFNRMFPLDVLLSEYFETTHEYDKLKRLIHLTPESLNALILFLYKENAWEINRRAFISDMKKTEETLARLQAEGKAPGNVRSWLLAYYGVLAEIYEREKNPCKSLNTLERLTRLDTKNHEAWFMLAVKSEKHLKKCGHSRQFVVNSYEKALSGEPENVTYLKGYARFLSEGGDMGKAEGIAMKIVELAPKDPEAREILAHIYEKTGRIEEAVAEMSEAVSLSRGEEYYRGRLSGLLKKR